MRAFLCAFLVVGCFGSENAAIQFRAKDNFVKTMHIDAATVVCNQRSEQYCLNCDAVMGDKPIKFQCCEDVCSWSCR